MFSRIGRWSRDLKFSFKLMLGFGAMVIIAVFIGAAALIMLNAVNNNTRDANTGSERAALAQEIANAMVDARDYEAAYFLKYEVEGLDAAYTRYVVGNQEKTNTILELIAQLQAATDTSDYEATGASDFEYRMVMRMLTLAADQTKAYQDLFNRTVVGTQELGVGEIGLAGQIETAGKALLSSPDLADPASQALVQQTHASIMYALKWGDLRAVVVTNQAHENFVLLQSHIHTLDISNDQKNALLVLVDNYLGAFDSYIDYYRNIAMQQGYMEILSANVVQSLENMALGERNAATVSLMDVRSVADQARTVNAVALIAAVFVAILLGYILVRILTRQIRELDRVLSDIRIGDFQSRAKVYGRDELGQVTDGVNGMLEQMTSLINESERERAALETAVTKLVEEVSELGSGNLSIKAAVNEDAATREIAKAFNYAIGELRGLVIGVENTAAEVTNASEAMTQVIEAMADQAASSAQVAEQATTRAQEGDRVVSETIAAMSRIRDNTQETAQRIKRLGEVSQEIGEAVRLIEELSDRTTVLALNASIQAAVAGEAGRGFAVVAEEVQRLAERAASATRKIEDLIKNIQGETNQAVIGVEEATREVVGGSRLAQQAGECMSGLNQLVAQLSALIQEVSKTTASQTSASMASLIQLSKGLQESVAAFGVVERVDGDDYSTSRN